MYIDSFKLNEPPFSLTPDPRFLFMSERHREGLAHLVYGIQQSGGFVQLTGEIGSGKTTLCRCLVRQLPPETDIALILNPRLSVVELLASVCDELGVSYPPETKSVRVLVDALNQRLLEAHSKGRRTVLIIDEAQNLDAGVLEQIRLLTNLETAQDKLLQIILIGQPELLSILRRKKLRQLAQRITARYHLRALSRRETYAYIKHRLLVAGRREPLFTGSSMRLIYRLSGGVPRLINIICDRALLGAYARDKQSVSTGMVRRASRESLGVIPWYRRLGHVLPAAVGALAALVLGSAVFLTTANLSLPHREPVVPETKADAVAQKTAEKTDEKPDARESAELVPMGGVVARETTASPGHDSPPADQGVKDPSITPGPVLTEPRLADILANPSLRGSGTSGFSTLYSIWGIKIPLDQSSLGCKAGSTEGIECLFKVGNWTKLRRFDLPAILELILPDGQRHRVALIGLREGTATLSIGGREYTFPLTEIDKVWDGSFILLWNHPFASHQLSPGSQGKDVIWIRQALDALDGKVSSPAPSDLYDEDLQRRVAAFQRQCSLPPDGFVGNETLVRLTLALEGPKAPSLSRQVRQ